MSSAAVLARPPVHGVSKCRSALDVDAPRVSRQRPRLNLAMQAAAHKARNGDLEFFTDLSPSDLSQLVQGVDDDGRNLLHTACGSRNTDLVALLLHHSPPTAIKAQDDEGWSPLHTASSCGHEAAVGLLLSAGADTGAQTNGGQTALHYAASKGHAAVARKLLAAGADVNAADRTGSTPLHRAAGAGKLEAARVLVLEGGAKLDPQDCTGASPLLVAVDCGEANLALFLAARGANLELANKDSETPLSQAGSMRDALLSATEMDLE